MFTQKLYINAHSGFICKSSKQSKCPTVGDELSKWWCIHTREYYLAIRKNELSTHAIAWMDFKCIMLSEKTSVLKAHIL